MLYSVCFTVGRPCAPEPPVVSEVRATSCTVTYQPPQYDGGAPVTGYILERHTPGPDSDWITVSDNPVTDLQYPIDSLTPATEYKFRVAAVNKKRMGDFSAESLKIMTLVKPDKPGRPRVVEVIGTSVRLQWSAPDSDGGADVTEYTILLQTSKKTEAITVSADANMAPLVSYTIRNRLKACTEYRFAVAAVNRMGQGPWSDVLEYTTVAGMLNITCLCSESFVQFHLSCFSLIVTITRTLNSAVVGQISIFMYTT